MFCIKFLLSLQAIGTMTLSAVLAMTTLTASKRMHKQMLSRVMQSPMAFFDTTPLGRIVNRFAKDVDVCDNTLPNNLRQWLNTFAYFVGTVILIIYKVSISAVISRFHELIYSKINVYEETILTIYSHSRFRSLRL